MIACPVPTDETGRVLLAHGGGGRAMRRLLRERIGPVFGAEVLGHDGAILNFGAVSLAFTTDGYVVHPLFFPGGDLGRLAVMGTVNDLAMCGARPEALSLALIAEEGLPLSTLDRILASVRDAAAEAGVAVVTGDTKVVERGKADGLYATTSGVGRVRSGAVIHPSRAAPGDAILVSGDIGRHGMAVLSVREGLAFESPITSDCASVYPIVAALLDAGVDVHVLRDPTRGGLAAALHEIASDAGLNLEIEEAAIPVSEAVAAACEILGLDPLHIACEGRFVAFVPEAHAEVALAAMSAVGAAPVRIGTALGRGSGSVVMRGPLGNRRPLDLPDGELLPRIC